MRYDHAARSTLLMLVAISASALRSFGDGIEDLPYGVGAQTKVTILTDLSGFDQTGFQCIFQDKDDDKDRHTMIGVPLQSCEIPERVAAASMIGRGNGFGSSGAHAAHAFAELRGDPTAGHSQALVGSGYIETEVRFVDRWSFEVEEGIPEGFHIAHIFTPVGSIETVRPGGGNAAHGRIIVSASIYNCSPQVDACADVTSPFNAAVPIDAYRAVISHDSATSTSTVDIVETVRDPGDPIINALDASTTSTVFTVFKEHKATRARTMLYGAFAVYDAFDLVPNDDGFVHLSELHYSLTARAEIEKLVGMRASPDNRFDEVDWIVPSSTRATVDATNSFALQAMLIETPSGDLVTPESLGIVVTSASGSPSPNVVPYEWSLPHGGFWQSGSFSRSGVPVFSHEQVLLGSAIEAPSTIAIDAPAKAGIITFDSPHGYVVAGASSLGLIGAPSASASIEVLQGDHEFQVDAELSADLTVDVAAASELTFNGPVNLNGFSLSKQGQGHLAINNRLLADGGSVVLVAGTLSGVGEIFADVLNLSGVVEPGASPGVLSIEGDYSQSVDAMLRIELGKSGHDLLDVKGALTLGGELRVEFVEAKIPRIGETFDILDFGAVSGQFDSVGLPTLPTGLTWDVTSLLVDGTLSIVSVPEPSSFLLVVLAGVAASVSRSHVKLLRRLLASALVLCSVPAALAESLHHWRFEDEPGFYVDSITGRVLTLEDAGAMQIGIPDAQRGEAFLGNITGMGDNRSAADFSGGPTAGLVELSPSTIGNEFTIEAFVHADSIEGRFGDFIAAQIGSLVDVAKRGDGWWLEVRHDGYDGTDVGELSFVLQSEGVYYLIQSDVVLAPGRDYYVAAALDFPGEHVTFYVKDLQAETPLEVVHRTHSAPSFYSDSPIHIGGWNVLIVNDGFAFDGLIDEVRLSTGVLSEDELLLAPEFDAPSLWVSSGGGLWTDESNWSFRPESLGEPTKVLFGRKIEGPSSVILDVDATVQSIEFDNPGTVVLVGAGTLNLDGNGGPARLQLSQGTHEVQAAVALNGDLLINVSDESGLLFGNMIEMNGNEIEILSGSVFIENRGSSSTPGSVVNHGRLGGGGRITGGLTNESDGTLVVEVLGPGEVIGLSVTEDAVLNGFLDVVGSYVPTAGEEFAVLDLGGISGETTLQLTPRAEERYVLTYTATSVLLTAKGELAADFNRDGKVDLLDFSILKGGFGVSPATFSQGDADGNETVDLMDFNILKNEFGRSQAVPEPTGKALSAVGLLALGAVGIRRRL